VSPVIATRIHIMLGTLANCYARLEIEDGRVIDTASHGRFL
jgi:hypothetical protein